MTTRPPTHPGGILQRDYLEPLRIGVSQLALVLKVSRKTVSKIIHGHGAITPDMALRLSRALSTTPQLWINLQRNYDLWYATHLSTAWRDVEILYKD